MISVAYWDASTGQIRVLGNGDTANVLGEIINGSFENLAEAVTKGAFYFKKPDNQIYIFNDTKLDNLPLFINNLFI